MVIVGAVHIAQTLAAIAAPAGYRVRVIDPRAAMPPKNVFPACNWCAPGPTRRWRPSRSPRAARWWCWPTIRKSDDAALAAALRSPAGYIGALGSARTQARRLARLGVQGFTPRELARIHGPVGLAIGARAPAEIASPSWPSWSSCAASRGRASAASCWRRASRAGWAATSWSSRCGGRAAGAPCGECGAGGRARSRHRGHRSG